MRFYYDEKEDRGECVAFIDGEGNLAISCNDGEALMISPDAGYPHVGSLSFEEWEEEHIETATRKFYPGDKITIEF